MKKLRLASSLSIPLSLVLFVRLVAASQVHVVVDGQYVSFPDVQPYIDHASGRTMVPARFVAEKLGAKVEWNGTLEQVTFLHKGRTIILTIGQKQARVNGKDILMDAPAVIKNDRTMVPLRFISELFEAQVEWKEERDLAVVTQAAKVEKGTWIWDAEIIQTDQEEILKFASENNLTAIYLQINRDVSLQDYQSFIRNAHLQQIQVEALAGNPYWAFKDNQALIREMITWITKYNASVDPKERFQGLHLDIEPYTLQEWKTENNLVLKNWMANLRFIEKETQGSGLKISLDVPFWIHKIKVPNSEYTFSAWLLEKFDSLVVMDYRNFSLGNNGIVANAHGIIREASALKKQVIIAVETAPTNEGDHTTFYTKSTGAMEEELQIAKKELSRYPSFAGFAVHDYKSWEALDERRDGR
ncbi:copper amine oxidase N-terminal domain-containing protein [Ammoniphilus sp. 3BR4]|uniref:copper amine oxidase N-terminal domain-containing protein n=1 Tax=Ammoniphilus sp. 3BR4 TaxID=3158265 RepID=UPI003466FB00